MALPARQFTPAFHYDPADWIELTEAARLLGANRDALGRRCREELADRDLAIYHRLPNGNKGWLVARALDHRLQSGRADAGDGPDLSSYTDKQQAVAWRRWQAVQRYRAERARRDGAADAWLPGLIEQLQADLGRPLNTKDIRFKISARSLRRWDAVCPSEREIENLIDKRGGDTRSMGDADAWRFFASIYLDPRRPSAKVCWRRARDHAREAGLAWCSYQSCTRQLADGNRPALSLEQQTKAREPDKWRSTMAPYIEQDAERFGAGVCWVGDHRPMDLMCRIATPKGDRVFRPWLTAWVDWRTRKVCGWVLTDGPNSSTILAALRMGIMDPAHGGGPSLVWIDNGRDFDCYSFHGKTKQQRRHAGRVEADEPQFQGIFGLLDIEAHFSLAFNPQGKARCERWFATVGAHFDKTFPTYTGKDVNHKPELLAKVLKEARHVPTFQQVRDRFADFVKGYNCNADHAIDDLFDEEEGRRLSPAEAMQRWRETRRVFADPGALDLCLQQVHRPVSFGRAGLKLTIAGRRLTFGRDLPELSRFKGKGKCLNITYDPHDLASVRVFDSQWRYVCDAPLDATGGVHGRVDQAHVSELARRKAAYNRSLRVVQDGFELQYRSDEELLADMAAEDALGQDEQAVANAASLKIVRTPMDNLVDSAQAAQQRKAAGADADELPNAMPGMDQLRNAYRHDDSDDPLAGIEDGGGWDITRLRRRGTEG